MLQTLLFFHILAVAGLFTGMTLETLALLKLHTARSVTDVRAALLNVPALAPIMGTSSGLLVVTGVALTYAGGYGWGAGWIDTVFGLSIALAILGPTRAVRRKSAALHALAQNSGDGAITPQIHAARCDRVFNYLVFATLFEVVAAIYVMVLRPSTAQAIAAIVAAALIALLPTALVVGGKEAAHVTP